MLFAIADLVQYLGRSRRYARYAPMSEMGAAFLGDLPPAAIELLKPGDVLFLSQYGSLIAWTIMYVTTSEVNHVAISPGAGQIAHATLGGLVVDRVASLYGPNVRILPVRVDETPERRKEIVRRALSGIGERYGWEAVWRKFVAIVLGRDRLYFRWKFFADVLLLLVFLDALLWPLVHRIPFSWLAVPYLLAIVVNLARWKRDPLPADHTYMNPQDALVALKAQRGRRVADAAALAAQAAARSRES